MSIIYTDKMASPLGDMYLGVNDTGELVSVDWKDDGRADFFSLDRFYPNHARTPAAMPADIHDALSAYFAGEISAIEHIQVALPGTVFQRAVWQSLLKIPAGTTCTYGGIAARVNNPGAMRAVGMANNANPIALVVPCHRVIGATGKMVGYGSGIKRKEWLLRHEGAASDAMTQGELVFY